MCNLYRQKKAQEAIRAVAKVMRDRTNLPLLDGIYPDKPAPIVREGPEGREMVMARWGLPTPDKHLGGKNYNKGTTNVRRPEIKHWAQWLGIENRCVVPVTAFAEPRQMPNGKFQNVWFALDESEPQMFFTGAWTEWTGVRMVKEGPVTCDVFAFLTTDANAEVWPYHNKAMPVILRTEEEIDTWLTAPISQALELQWPLPDGSLYVFPTELPTESDLFNLEG